MDRIAPELPKYSVLKYDKYKTLNLKSSALGLSPDTSNTFVLALTDERTPCQDVRDMNYNLLAWVDYAFTQEVKRQGLNELENTAGPAFRRKD